VESIVEREIRRVSTSTPGLARPDRPVAPAIVPPWPGLAAFASRLFAPVDIAILVYFRIIWTGFARLRDGGVALPSPFLD
jgi:hypothetical protein